MNPFSSVVLNDLLISFELTP